MKFESIKTSKGNTGFSLESQEKANEQAAKMDANNNTNCYNCRYCSGCSDCSGCSSCIGCSDCSDCSGCRYCSGCSGCSDCSDCSDCSGCIGCSDCSDKKETPVKIPVIEQIDQAVYAAVTAAPDALNMSKWHVCDTTHCRAGWVVHLAGEEGYALQKFFNSTALAAQLIYRESRSPINPCRFFDSNENALADMKQSAEINK